MKTPCKRLSRPETQEERRARLAERRIRQLDRRPGFIPVPNARVDGAIATQQALLAATGAYNAVEALHEARRRVARLLPPPPMVKSHRRRPSKSDNPEYRRGNR
jgi:hypothetical protein